MLLAYFSRAGENYYYGGRTTLKVGNSEVMAREICDLIDCDMYRIEPADPYSSSYNATVKRNVREQDSDARPAIKGSLPDLDGYETVLLGSPIWNVHAPMIMTTFTEQLDFSGKTVVPFTEGLAVQGEEVAQAYERIKAWLQPAGQFPPLDEPVWFTRTRAAFPGSLRRAAASRPSSPRQCGSWWPRRPPVRGLGGEDRPEYG